MNRSHGLSKRALHTPPSPIRRLAGFAVDAEQRGVQVIRLNIGQPDLTPPSTFLDAVRNYEETSVAYETSQGNGRLRSVWTAYLDKAYGLGLRPEHMLITMGASEALIFAFMVCCDPGDEIIVFDPTYANYQGFAAISGVHLVPVACAAGDNFHLPDRSSIESQISRRTRAILACSPNNPSGTVYTRDELKMLQSICNDRGLFFIVDETYREFVYDGLEPHSALELGDDPSVIVVDSLSKRFSLCGARIGALITRNEECMQCAFHIAQARLAAPTIEQEAAATMLESIDDAYIKGAITEYRDRRDVLHGAMSRVPGVTSFLPEGAFYSILHLPVRDAEAFATFLLQSFSYQGKTLFLAPASGFYMTRGAGKAEARIAFVLQKQLLEEAGEILARGLEEYGRRST